jgi:hypothetical protein
VWERVCIDGFLRGGPLFSSMIREPGDTGIHMGGLTQCTRKRGTKECTFPARSQCNDVVQHFHLLLGLGGTMFLSLYSCIVSNQPYGSQYTRFSWFYKFGPNVFWPVTGAEVDVDWRRRRPRSSYRLCRVGGGDEGGKRGTMGISRKKE